MNNASSASTASSNWQRSTYSYQRYSADYRFATPEAVSDTAWFKAGIPAAGNYEVYAWFPANQGYNASTPCVISTAGGNRTVRVNQQINGSTWVSLGTFTLNAGTYNVVGVSHWTIMPGYIMADAVRIMRRA